MSPPVGFDPPNITIVGSGLPTDPVISLRGGGLCEPLSASATSIVCVPPNALAAGSYPVAVWSASTGDRALSAVTYHSTAVISSVTPNFVSLLGGLTVTTTLNGAPLSAKPAVTIGGHDCPVTAFNSTAVECTAPAAEGALYAELFVLDEGATLFPDLSARTAQASGYASAFDFNWARDVPFELGGVKDFWALRLSGYMRFDTAGNYSFDMIADDGGKLYVDDSLVYHMTHGGVVYNRLPYVETSGWKKFRVVYHEIRGHARF